MATLVPSFHSCSTRMEPGERRFARRLEEKLEDEYLVWYDVPVGPKQLHPDFIILHPRRGIFILEVKNWKLETIRQVTPMNWVIAPEGEEKIVKNPC